MAVNDSRDLMAVNDSRDLMAVDDVHAVDGRASDGRG